MAGAIGMHGTATDTGSLDTGRMVLEGIFGPVAEREFGVRLWDGTLEGPDDALRVLILSDGPAGGHPREFVISLP